MFATILFVIVVFVVSSALSLLYVLLLFLDLLVGLIRELSRPLGEIFK